MKVTVKCRACEQTYSVEVPDYKPELVVDDCEECGAREWTVIYVEPEDKLPV